MLWPHADSSMAWAIVTDAGTPYFRCVAIAPGATCSMNARWSGEPGTVGWAAGACWWRW